MKKRGRRCRRRPVPLMSCDVFRSVSGGNVESVGTEKPLIVNDALISTRFNQASGNALSVSRDKHQVPPHLSQTVKDAPFLTSFN